jgi:hypothetical protein
VRSGKQEIVHFYVDPIARSLRVARSSMTWFNATVTVFTCVLVIEDEDVVAT